MAERIENGWYSRLEGYDGVGKTTLLRLAREYDHANNLGAVFIREPGGTELGLVLRSILLNSDYQLTPQAQLGLLTSDRRYLWDSVIEPALVEGRPVISDRGFESSWCYQGAGGDIDPEFILSVTSLLIPKRYITPDALVVLQLSDEERMRRLNQRLFETGQTADNIESMDSDYHRRVFEAYQRLPQQFGGIAVSADPPPEEVFEQALPHLFGPFVAR